MTVHSPARDVVDHLHTLDGFTRGENLFVGIIPPGLGFGDPVLGVLDTPGEPDYLAGEIESPRIHFTGRGGGLDATWSFVEGATRVFASMAPPGNPDAGDGAMRRGTADASDPQTGYSGFWAVIAPHYLHKDARDRHVVTATMRAYRYKEV